MRQYILRRLLQTIPILIGVSILVFAVIKTTPGDPFSYLFGRNVDTSVKEKLKAEYGLDKPLPVQYFNWVKQTAQGNLGYSIRTGKPVTEMMGQYIPKTLLLTVSAFLIGLMLAIPIGVISATRQYSVGDYVATTGSFIGISLPGFFTALLAQYFIAVKLQWLPLNGTKTIGADLTGMAAVFDTLKYLTLPALVLAVREIAGYSRFARSSMLETLRQDYVRTARSKGLSERIVIYKHALRNSLIPIVTLLGFSLPELFGGAVIIETLFSWRGMGVMTLEAVGNRDYPVLMATNMFFALLVVVGNLVADILYAIVDPRIRYS